MQQGQRQLQRITKKSDTVMIFKNSGFYDRCFFSAGYVDDKDKTYSVINDQNMKKEIL